MHLPTRVAACSLLLAGLLAGLFAGPLCSATLAETDVEGSKRQLEEIRQRLDRKTRDLQQKKQAELQIVNDMKTVKAQLSRIRARDRQLSDKVRRTEASVLGKEKEAAGARKQVNAMEGRVRQRLVALYKFGDSGPLRIVFSSLSPSEMTSQYRSLQQVVRHDRQLLDSYKEQLGRLDKALADLETLRGKQSGLLSEVQQNRSQLQEARRLKRKLLAEVRKDKDLLAVMVAGLKEKKERLERLIKKLETAPGGGYSAKAGPFFRLKGRIPRPMKGKIQVSFGPQRHPELGTLYSSHGIEIAAAEGTPIAAVGSGRVVFADSFKGYGKLVIVDHGNSYHTLYGHALHLDRGVGDRVKAGEILARAGFPGTGGLYFEIRHHGVPLDPLSWFADK